tara:strand:- start:1776 stop:2006 length:231 start_codon:yes stop_codon:yes gene_type:complete
VVVRAAGLVGQLGEPRAATEGAVPDGNEGGLVLNVNEREYVRKVRLWHDALTVAPHQLVAILHRECMRGAAESQPS